MQYQIGDFTLCTIEGIAKSAQSEHKVRPKTLQVFQYLVEHRDRIATKREIIDTIWDDVVVQDQVLFQSIKELRDIFTGTTVIKTFPRKGYQWVGDVSVIAPVTDSSSVVENEPDISNVSGNKVPRYIWPVLLVLAVSFAAILMWQFTQQEPLSSHELDIAVLPVIDDMEDADHQWVPLAGMDILIHQLQQVPDLTTLNTDDILHSLERTGAYSELTLEEQVYRVRQATGAEIVVQTSLRGYPQDYQLHYSLISPHSVERGVEFSDSIEGLMLAMSQTIAQRFGRSGGDVVAYKSDFSHEAFASGVEHYMSERFAVAEPFLQAAVSASPELLAARRFLAGSLAHTGQLEQAIILLQDNIERAKHSGDRREEVRAILMTGSWLANDGQTRRADTYLTVAKQLAEGYEDQLFTAYAYEELGRIRRHSGQYQEAEALLKVALSHQQSFQCPYGQTNVLVELGRNAFELGRTVEAERYLNDALAIAEENNVAVNRFWTLLALAEMHGSNGNVQASKDFALQAKALAGDVHDDYLVNKASNWLSSVAKN